MDKSERPENITAALALYNQYGDKLTDEQLTKIAAHFNYRAKRLIRNYRFIVKVEKILE